MVDPLLSQSWLARLTEAEAATKAENWPLARELWDRLRADYPNDPACWRKAAEAYRQEGTTVRARLILEQAVQLFPNDLWVAYENTLIAQRMEDWRVALLRARDMRQRFPEAPLGALLEGEAQRALGSLDAADAAFGDAVERFPTDEWARYQHALLAADRQRWDEALRRWDELLKLSPQHVEALNGRARAVAALSRSD